MKNKKTIIITIAIILLIILILMINILDKPKEEKQPQSQEEVNLLKDYSSIDALFAFSGTYMKNNYIIVMNVISNKNINFTVTDGKNFSSLTLELDRNNHLVNQEELMNIEKLSIKITKVEDGIKIESSSEIEESIFNELSNTYSEREFKAKGWSGYYVKDNNIIIIDEYDDGMMYLSIDEINYSNYFDTFNQEQITLEEAFTGGLETVTIKKTDNGIVLKSNKKGDKYLFARISGEYNKEN